MMSIAGARPLRSRAPEASPGGGMLRRLLIIYHSVGAGGGLPWVGRRPRRQNLRATAAGRRRNPCASSRAASWAPVCGSPRASQMPSIEAARRASCRWPASARWATSRTCCCCAASTSRPFNPTSSTAMSGPSRSRHRGRDRLHRHALRRSDPAAGARVVQLRRRPARPESELRTAVIDDTGHEGDEDFIPGTEWLDTGTEWLDLCASRSSVGGVLRTDRQPTRSVAKRPPSRRPAPAPW